MFFAPLQLIFILAVAPDSSLIVTIEAFEPPLKVP